MPGLHHLDKLPDDIIDFDRLPEIVRDFVSGINTFSGWKEELEPILFDLYGTPTLLLHGDLLCTDDTAFQQFRAQTRDPRWQAQFLAQPLAARLAFAAQARAASQARYGELVAKGMAETIGDVAPATVQDWFTRFDVQRMIHGHTHRPAIHDEGDGRTRIVLGDWYEQGSALRIGAGVTDLASLTQA